MIDKTSTQQYKTPRKFWLCVVLAGVLAAGCCLFLAAPLEPIGETVKLAGLDSSGVPADTSWEVYVVENGRPRPLTDVGDDVYSGLAYEGQTFYAACTLGIDSPDALLELWTPFPTVLFLDDQVLYADTDAGSPEIGQLSLSPPDNMRMEALLVSLPPDYAGRKLTIAQAQYYGDSEPVLDVYIPDTTLLSAERYNSEQIAAGAQVFYPGIALFMMSVFLLIVMVVNAYYGEPVAAPIYLSSFCLLWMICLYTSSIPLQLLEYYQPLPYYVFFYFGGSGCLVLFLANYMRGRPQITLCILAVLPLAAVIVLSSTDTLAELSLVPELLQIAALIAAAVLSSLEARQVAFFRIFTRLLAGSALGFSLFTVWQASANSAWFRGFALQFQLGYTFADLASAIQALFIIACFGSLVWEFVRQLNNRRLQTILAEERQHMAETSLKQYRRHIHETALLQHDIRRHLAMVGLYLKENQTPEALDYLSQIGLQFEAVPKVVSTGNATIDLILNAKLNEMQDAGIQAGLLTEKLPEFLPLTEAEISSLLLNTLDNAIRAASVSEGKTVDVKLYARNGFLYYSCRNAAPPQEETPVRLGDGHGYGLQIVRQIAEQHGGVARVQQEGGSFQITCVLALLSPGTEMR